MCRNSVCFSFVSVFFLDACKAIFSVLKRLLGLVRIRVCAAKLACIIRTSCSNPCRFINTPPLNIRGVGIKDPSNLHTRKPKVRRKKVTIVNPQNPIQVCSKKANISTKTNCASGPTSTSAGYPSAKCKRTWSRAGYRPGTSRRMSVSLARGICSTWGRNWPSSAIRWRGMGWLIIRWGFGRRRFWVVGLHYW